MTWRGTTSLAAGGLLLLSAILQGVASTQRWVDGIAAGNRTDWPIEDHRFDYTYPSDPWEPIGAAAQLSGLGMVLLGAGIIVLAVAVRPTSTAGRVVTLVACVAAALPFVLFGAHGALSGLSGTPSPLVWAVTGTAMIVAMVAQIIGLATLAIVSAIRSITLSVATAILIAVTPVGYLAASFLVAPVIAGYQSFDTTPWTETVLAAWTAAAALFVVIGALVLNRRPSER